MKSLLEGLFRILVNILLVILVKLLRRPLLRVLARDLVRLLVMVLAKPVLRTMVQGLVRMVVKSLVLPNIAHWEKCPTGGFPSGMQDGLVFCRWTKGTLRFLFNLIKEQEKWKQWLICFQNESK